MTVALSIPETLLNTYQTIECNFPEDIDIHTRHHENLQTHLSVGSQRTDISVGKS
jgi:hypothetical protein